MHSLIVFLIEDKISHHILQQCADLNLEVGQETVIKGVMMTVPPFLSKALSDYQHEPTTLSVVNPKFGVQEITSHFNAIADVNVFRSLMIMLKDESEADPTETFKKSVAEFENGGMLFHLIIVESNSTDVEWYQVLKVKFISQAVINPVRFDRYGHIIENYDMQGLQIASVDIDWPPFFEADGCDKNSRNCKPTGTDHAIYLNIHLLIFHLLN